MEHGTDEPMACLDCGEGVAAEYYMVHNALWNAATNVDASTHEFLLGGQVACWDECEHQAMLCIGCLERRLGRRLDARDFPESVALNRKIVLGEVAASSRLLDRMFEGLAEHGLAVVTDMEAAA